MKALTRSLIIFVLAVAAIKASAQDFRQALESMRAKYGNAENLQMKVTIEVFDAPGVKHSFYKEQVKISKRGSEYHHRLSSTDMIMNQKYIVVVDHSIRQILINKRDVRGESEFYKHAQFNMDSILQFYEEGKYEGSKDGVNKFSVIQKSGDIKKIELSVYESGELSQINYLYKTGQWATITFNEFTVSPTFDIKEFDENQFVQRPGKKWLPAPSLAGYVVVDASKENVSINN